MKICYVEHNFRAATMAIIEQADAIIEEYAADGYDMTVRQVYYQFIGRDLFPATWIDEAYNLRKGLASDTKNTDKNYDRLGQIVNKARLAGYLDWERIVDLTRFLRGHDYKANPSEAIEDAVAKYIEDIWADQEYKVEVWIEKDAALSVTQRVCGQLAVDYFSCRGYASTSSLWRAARRLDETGKRCIILQVGDHDPSGVDMSRDLQDRINLFTDGDELHTVQRICLTMEQIREHQLPPNPAKVTDSRARAYMARHGRDSWELDALSPTVLADIVRTAVTQHMDVPAWQAALAASNRNKAMMQQVSDDWDSIAQQYGGQNE